MLAWRPERAGRPRVRGRGVRSWPPCGDVAVLLLRVVQGQCLAQQLSAEGKTVMATVDNGPDRRASLPNIHACHDGRPTVMAAFISSSSEFRCRSSQFSSAGRPSGRRLAGWCDDRGG
jgi:hypothetical protein